MRESTTNSTHIWRQRQDSNRGHIGGRGVLSPLHHPCSPDPMVCYGIFWSGQLLMHCSLPEIRLHFSMVFSTSGAPFKRRWEMFACGIQDPGNFCACGIWNFGLWNPEPHHKNWDLESNFHFPESSAWNPESTPWNPESKSRLGFSHTRQYGYSHPFLKLTTPLISNVYFFFQK